MKKKPTIAELEALLNSDDDRNIFIAANGEVKTKRGKKGKLLTFKQNLGGEYGTNKTISDHIDGNRSFR